MPRFLSLLAMLLLPGALSADFKIEGGANTDFLETAGVVAVLPAICPAKVDCGWLDRRIAGELQRRKKPQFRSVEAGRAALVALGSTELSAANRSALGEALGAQTLLEIRVRELEKERREGKPDADDEADSGEGLAANVRGRLEIRAMSVQSGATLAQGAAFGDANVGTEKRLLGPMLTQLMGRMFPLPRH
ncbi:MAG: hypothetical protein ABIV06_00285 [Thermoanaerobaculia bacterium]